MYLFLHIIFLHTLLQEHYEGHHSYLALRGRIVNIATGKLESKHKRQNI